jgi:hypothetical protein
MDWQSVTALESPLSASGSDDTRLERFGDWIVAVPNIAEEISNPGRSIYHGGDVATRMDAIRRTIQHIRGNWSDYPKFVQILRDHIQSQPHAFSAGKEEQDLVDSVLSTRKEWLDRQMHPSTSDNFDVVRLYTSKFGYDHIFSPLNSALRTDNLPDYNSLLLATVFLIELLNIDLYNFLLTRPSAAFQGSVFRGVSFHRDQIQEFRNIAARPVRDRYLSIPHSIMSASSSTEVALKFARIDANNRTTHQPFLWRIHVADLDPALLKIYRDRFPQSVVTTLCAVPIHELSQFEKEQEVLLRGPFFQLIRIADEVVDGYEPAVPVMDLVMLNTNRDHPSTMELGELQDEARKILSCLVGMGRAVVCKQVAEKYHLVDDVKVYGEMFDEQQKKLNELLADPHLDSGACPKGLFPKLWDFGRTCYRGFICRFDFQNWSCWKRPRKTTLLAQKQKERSEV